MRHEFLHHYLLSSLSRKRNCLGVWNDDFLQVVDEVTVYVVSRTDATDRHLLQSICTEYSKERPSRVSPYMTLWMTSFGGSSVPSGVVIGVFKTVRS